MDMKIDNMSTETIEKYIKQRKKIEFKLGEEVMYKEYKAYIIATYDKNTHVNVILFIPGFEGHDGNLKSYEDEKITVTENFWFVNKKDIKKIT